MKSKCLILTLTIFFSILGSSFAQDVGQPLMVRLIYFLPSNQIPQPDIDTKMDTMIKDVQLFFADLMESHGFDRKTFTFEVDATGQAVVHHINGLLADTHYQRARYKVWNELNLHFDLSRNIYLVAIELSDPILLLGPDFGTCGLGGYHGTAAGNATAG